MKRQLRVVTEARFCKETGQLPIHNKPFGYVVQIIPPIVTFSTQTDVEGVGLWRHSPQRHAQHAVGWYKYKIDAEVSMARNQSSSFIFRDDQPRPVEKRLDFLPNT